MQKIISLVNNKGGVGKSTATINIGSLLAVNGYKILVIDLSTQANTSHILGGGQKYDKGIGEVLLYEDSYEDVLYQSLYSENLYLLPSTDKLTAYKDILKQIESSLGFDSVVKRFSFLNGTDYDYVFIDCDPDFSIFSDLSMAFANHFLVPLEPGEFSYMGMAKIFERIQTVRNLEEDPAISQPNWIKFFINKFEKRRKKSSEYADISLEQYNGMLLKKRVRNLASIQEAHDYKKPLLVHDSQSQGTQDFTKLTEEILEIWP